jgi:hypothetical protein
MSSSVSRLKALYPVSVSTAVSEPHATTESEAPKKCPTAISFYIPGTHFEERCCLPISGFTLGSISAAKSLSDTRGPSRLLPYLPNRAPLTILAFPDRASGAIVTHLDLNSRSLDIFCEAQTLDGATYYVPWRFVGGEIASIRGEAVMSCDSLPIVRPNETGCTLNAYRMCVDLANKMDGGALIAGGDQQLMIEDHLIRLRCILDTATHGISRACVVSGEENLVGAAAAGHLGAARDRLVERGYLSCLASSKSNVRRSAP